MQYKNLKIFREINIYFYFFFPDSTGTEDLTSASGASACTTQPLVQALQPPEASPLLGTIGLLF